MTGVDLDRAVADKLMKNDQRAYTTNESGHLMKDGVQ
jgi:hypothetical protein